MPSFLDNIQSVLNIFAPNLRMLGPLSIDAVVTELHRSPVEITKYPVEFGATINDHVIIRPKEYIMDGIVSNTAVGFTNFQLPNFFSGTTETRASSALKILYDLQATREPIDVQTGLILYTNMILSDITVNMTKETAGGLYFTAVLSEVIIVKSKSVSVDPNQYAGGSTRQQAAPRVNRGREIGTERPFIPQNSDAYNKYFGGNQK